MAWHCAAWRAGAWPAVMSRQAAWAGVSSHNVHRRMCMPCAHQRRAVKAGDVGFIQFILCTVMTTRCM